MDGIFGNGVFQTLTKTRTWERRPEPRNLEEDLMVAAFQSYKFLGLKKIDVFKVSQCFTVQNVQMLQNCTIDVKICFHVLIRVFILPCRKTLAAVAFLKRNHKTELVDLN